MTQVAQHIINNPVISHHQRWTTQNRDQRGVYDKKSLVIGKESTDQNESAIVPEMQRGILIKYIIILLFLLYIQCLYSMLELIRTHNADYAITPISAWPSEELRTIDTLWTHTHTHTLKLPCQLHSNVTICYNYSVRTIVRRRNYTFPIIEPSVLLNAYTALYARIRKKKWSWKGLACECDLWLCVFQTFCLSLYPWDWNGPRQMVQVVRRAINTYYKSFLSNVLAH